MAAGDPPTNTEPAVRLEATVRGRVQGVGYRYFAMRRATQLGLVGWVANAADGSVRCVAEGPRADLEQLCADLAIGPAGALIEAVRPDWRPATRGFHAFEIRSGAHRGD